MLPGAIFAALVMLVTGFFFAAVSGNLVGLIGSSNNPISGLTLATTIVAALTMVIVGVKGVEGVAAVLGVAAVVCVSSAVAGEMLQDLKVGHILGGTPWKMQVGDLIGVVVAGLVLFFPLYLLHTSDLASNPDERRLRRPGALGAAGRPDGLALAGHRGRRDGLAAGGGRDRHGHRADPGAGQEPDAVLGRHVPAARDHLRDLRRRRWSAASSTARREKRGYNAAQKARVENAGVLTASGLIAGEALMGLVAAGVVAFKAYQAASDPSVVIAFPQVPGVRECRLVAGDPGHDLPARLPDAPPARERGPGRRAGAADGGDVTSGIGRVRAPPRSRPLRSVNRRFGEFKEALVGARARAGRVGRRLPARRPARARPR